MTNRLPILLAAGMVGHAGDAPSAVASRGKAPIDLGTRRELFVDGYMIDALAGDARRVLHQPTPREVALAFDAPWEGKDSAHMTVMKDDDRVRLRGQPPQLTSSGPGGRTC